MLRHLNGCQTIVVESMDRFARDLTVQIALTAALRAQGIALISASTGQDITADVENNPMAEALILMQGVFSQLEKRNLVSKLRKSRDAVRARGVQCEGTRPFGTVDGEQDTLKRMKELRRKPRGGKRRSCGVIARILEEEGRKTRSGRPWNRGCVHAILQR